MITETSYHELYNISKNNFKASTLSEAMTNVDQPFNSPNLTTI